jgi:hypothetical protein
MEKVKKLVCFLGVKTHTALSCLAQQLKMTTTKQQGRYLEEAFWDFKARVICSTSMSAV